MKGLEERLEERKQEYELLVKREYQAQKYIDDLLKIIPEDTNINLSIYGTVAFIYLSFDSVEDFEENYITEISSIFNAGWVKSVGEDEITHVLRKDGDNYDIRLIAQSKPTDHCRITRILTGKTRMVCKEVQVEELEYEYLIECNDD